MQSLLDARRSDPFPGERWAADGDEVPTYCARHLGTVTENEYVREQRVVGSQRIGVILSVGGGHLSPDRKSVADAIASHVSELIRTTPNDPASIARKVFEDTRPESFVSSGRPMVYGSMLCAVNKREVHTWCMSPMGVALQSAGQLSLATTDLRMPALRAAGLIPPSRIPESQLVDSDSSMLWLGESRLSIPNYESRTDLLVEPDAMVVLLDQNSLPVLGWSDAPEQFCGLPARWQEGLPSYALIATAGLVPKLPPGWEVSPLSDCSSA